MVRERAAARNGAAANGRAGHDQADDADQGGGAELVAHPLTSFRARDRDWVLPGRIAFGSLVIVGGDKQAGKSTLAGAIAAHLAGAPGLLPGQSHFLRSCTLWVTSEEDPGRDILPRIRAMGGDPGRVSIIGRDPRGARARMPCLPGEWDALGELAAAQSARFLLIDGIASMIRPGLRLNDEGQARELFDPAAEVAERLGLLISVIRHNRKAPASTGAGQILGSVGVTGAARTVLQVRALPGQTGLRVVTAETNMGPQPPPLLCRIEDRGGVGVLVWEGDCDPSDKRITDALPDAGRVLQGTAAESFVAAYLRGGPAKAKDVFTEGLRDGYGSDSLWRAAKRIGVTIRREGFGPASFSLWSLPPAAPGVRATDPVRSMQSVEKPRPKRARKPRKTP